MIVKFLSDDGWCILDNVRRSSATYYDARKIVSDENKKLLAEMYDEEKSKNYTEKDIEALKENIKAEISDKVTSMTNRKLLNRTTYVSNKIDIDKDVNFTVLMAVFNDNSYGGSNEIIIITNNTCYLMNDDGKTIERLK